MAFINHRAVADDVIGALNIHSLNRVQAVKCLIYTATKLVAKEYGCSDVDAAGIVSDSALNFRDEIKRIERMVSNKG